MRKRILIFGALGLVVTGSLLVGLRIWSDGAEFRAVHQELDTTIPLAQRDCRRYERGTIGQPHWDDDYAGIAYPCYGPDRQVKRTIVFRYEDPYRNP